MRTIEVTDAVPAELDAALCKATITKFCLRALIHDGAREGRMPKRWHTRLILEDKQDTGQIFYARKLQMLDRIGAHMTTLCVRPCFRDPPTQIQS